MLRSQDNQVFVIFNNPMIYQICNVMTRDRVRFWICILNHDSISHQTWPTDMQKEGK